jgi:hypothetical protein
VVAPVPVLLGADQPGEVAGEPVPAEVVRALARGLGLLPDLADAAPPDAARRAAGSAEGDPADAALVAADERWWAEVEARALRGDWGGAEHPPLEELERYWAHEAETDRALTCSLGTVDEPVPRATASAAVQGAVPVTDAEPSWWAAADDALDDASATLLELDHAVVRARRTVHAAEIADAADRDAWEESPAAQMTAAPDSLAALEHASAEQRSALADLLSRTGGGGLADRPRIAVTDALTGALLLLTDARDLRAAAVAGRGLGPPGPDPTYRPGAALDRFLRARDRRCRFPGCRRRVPRGGELDHNRPWPAGPTAAGNLTGFCTGHHRGKHQAPGWRHDLTGDGTLTVITPTGLVAGTDPPPY